MLAGVSEAPMTVHRAVEPPEMSLSTSTLEGTGEKLIANSVLILVLSSPSRLICHRKYHGYDFRISLTETYLN